MTITTISPRQDHAALVRYARYVSGELLSAADRTDTATILAILGRLPDGDQPKPIVGALERAARAFGVTVADIQSTSRRREKVDARAVYCYAARLLGYPYGIIGQHVDRDHSTVRHACGRVGETPRLRGIAERIAGALGWDREAS